MPDQIDLKKLPRQNSPDYFRTLVRNCIETYKYLPNDAMCLDYNRVSGKLRALVLDDEEYKQETRNIYARQRLEELNEIDVLAKLTTHERENGADEGAMEEDPRDRKTRKKGNVIDKDSLTMRFKAAQMRRELIASLNDNDNASERDAVNFLFVAMTREEVDKNVRLELHEGSDDDALDELTTPKEEAPEGTSGKIRERGQSGALSDEDFFETLPDGEIVEK
jgi:hypothetical protein